MATTTRRDRRHGMPEVLLAGMLWMILLVMLLAVYSLPELGTWIYR